MNDKSDLKQVAKSLLQEQKVAVLATHGAGQPYTSLVAFAATDDLRSIFPRNSRKINLVESGIFKKCIDKNLKSFIISP